MTDFFTRLLTWFRSIHWTRTDKIAAACLGAFLALGLSCAGCTAVGNAIGANTAQTANVVTSSGPTATPRPTAKPRATATPRPTATPKPTATPRPTATPKPTVDPLLADQQTVQHLASENCNFTANSVNAVFTPSSDTVSVTVVVGPQWDVSAAQTTVETIVFNCFQGFYTSPHAGFVQDVKVLVNGPVTDAYGNSSTGLYGDADLTRTTAQPFNWNGLDYKAAWDNYIYDSQYVRTS